MRKICISIIMLVCITCLKCTSVFAGFIVYGLNHKPKVYMISIGISYKTDSSNNLKNGDFFVSNECKACLSDASGVANHITRFTSVDTVVKYVYLNNNINIDTLYKTFNDIQKKANPSDIFVFYYSGISWGKKYNLEIKTDEGFYAVNKIHTSEDANNYSFTLRTLKVLTDRIAPLRQLIIFDTGNGEVISNDFYKNFFSANPAEANFTKKNRVIICPEYDSGESVDKKDSLVKGDLYKVISNMPDSLNVFNIFDTSYKKSFSEPQTAYKKFIKTWYEKQLECLAQIKILKELDYLEILSSIKPNIVSEKRGISLLQQEQKVDSSLTSRKKKALIVATNNYNASSIWSNLRNPINDGMAMKSILEKVYGYETISLFDASQDSILQAITNLCDDAENPYSQYIIYFAGHGFFDSRQKAGYVVCKDSKPFKDPLKPSMVELKSYLDYTILFKNIEAKLNKVIFITDVCFGGTSLNSLIQTNINTNPTDEINKSKNPYKRVLASGVTEVSDFLRLQNGGLSNNSPFAIALLETLKKNKSDLSFETLFSEINKQQLKPEPIEFLFGNIVKPNEFIF